MRSLGRPRASVFPPPPFPNGSAKQKGTKALEITQTCKKGGLTSPKYETLGGTTMLAMVITQSEPLPASQHAHILP